MDFKKWWDMEGSVMFERGCSAEVISMAAWKARSGEDIKIIDEMMVDMVPSDIEYLTLTDVAAQIADDGGLNLELNLKNLDPLNPIIELTVACAFCKGTGKILIERIGVSDMELSCLNCRGTGKIK